MKTIMTIRGEMDVRHLTYHRIITDNENEYTVREEWRDGDGVEVRSDVHVTLKRAMPISAAQGSFG